MSRRTVSRAALSGLSLAVLALVAAAPAHAAGDPSAPFLGLPGWMWMTLNLALFLGGLAYLIVPPFRRALEARTRSLEESMVRAREQQDSARNLEATLGAKIAQLEAEIDQLGERAATEGRREHDEILRQAERERDRLLSQAKGEIDHRLDQARQELKSYTAALAAELARERLEQDLDPARRSRLFEDNVARLKREVGPRQEVGS